jgi:hypothetical protein
MSHTAAAPPPQPRLPRDNGPRRMPAQRLEGRDETQIGSSKEEADHVSSNTSRLAPVTLRLTGHRRGWSHTARSHRPSGSHGSATSIAAAISTT